MMTKNHNTQNLAQQDTTTTKQNHIILHDNSLLQQDTLNKHEILIIKDSRIKIKKIPERVIQPTTKPVHRIKHIKKRFNLYQKNINDTISGTQYDSIASPIFDVAQMKYVFPVKKNTSLKQTYFYDVSVLETKNTKTDSIISKHSAQKHVYFQNIITHLKRTPNEKFFVHTDWILIVALLSLALFSWINLVYKKFISSIFLSAINLNSANKMFIERNIMTNRISFGLNIIYLINTSIIGYFIFHYYNLGIIGCTGFETSLIFFGVLSIIYSIKLFVFKILDFILLSKKKFTEYYYNIFIYNKIYGIILFPLILAIPFTSNIISVILIKTAIVILIILYLFKILRGIQISIQIRLSFFYLFLYLCALEIIPILIIYRIVTTYIL